MNTSRFDSKTVSAVVSEVQFKHTNVLTSIHTQSAPAAGITWICQNVFRWRHRCSHFDCKFFSERKRFPPSPQLSLCAMFISFHLFAFFTVISLQFTHSSVYCMAIWPQETTSFIVKATYATISFQSWCHKCVALPIQITI